MVGEVISAPDASNYYLLLVPTEEQVTINGTKLRLIQRAGAAKAPFNPGDVVDVRGNGNMVHRASVVKVNGGGCQVKAQGMVGWGECKKLRVVQQGTKPQGAAQADTE